MKRIMIAALAFSLLAGTTAAAQDRDHGNGRDGERYERRYDREDCHGDYRNDDRRGGYRDGRGYGPEQRRWQRGQRLPGAYRGSGIDYRSHNLRRPPRGYQWVQMGGGAYVLTDSVTGLILDVINGY